MNDGKLRKDEKMALFYVLNPLPNEEYSKKKKLLKKKQTIRERLTRKGFHTKNSSLNLLSTYKDLGSNRIEVIKREQSINLNRICKTQTNEKVRIEPRNMEFSTNPNEIGVGISVFHDRNEVSYNSGSKKVFATSFVSDLAEEESLFRQLESKSQGKSAIKEFNMTSSPIPNNKSYIKIFTPKREVNLDDQESMIQNFIKNISTYSESQKKAFDRVFLRDSTKIKTKPERIDGINEREKELKEKITLLSDDILLLQRKSDTLRSKRDEIKQFLTSIELKSEIWSQYWYTTTLNCRIFDILRRIIFQTIHRHQIKCKQEKDALDALLKSASEFFQHFSSIQCELKTLKDLKSLVKSEFLDLASAIIEENWNLINIESESRSQARKLTTLREEKASIEKKMNKETDFRLSDRLNLTSQSENLEHEKSQIKLKTEENKLKLSNKEVPPPVNTSKEKEELVREISQLKQKEVLFDEGLRGLLESQRSKASEVQDLKESIEKFKFMKEKQEEEIGKLKSSMKRRAFK